MKILVLNSGSSSQKACLYEIAEVLPENPPPCLWEGKIEWDGETAKAVVKTSHGVAREAQVKFSSRRQAVKHLVETLWSGKAPAVADVSEIHVVGHRVVHGGQQYEKPTLITPEVKAGIGSVSAFAPLHNRAELEGMEVIERLLGPIPQIAVFDTGFHRNLPQPAAVYPGPYEWFERGIRRYGFHGINHQYCAARAARVLRRDLKSLKLVTCHLGNGCSLAAIREANSVDTTMGFTPLEGLMMGTRSGSIDPGILTYLMRQRRLQGQDIDDLLNQRSGLLGVSGISGDMRQILSAIRRGNKRAQLAFDIYVHRLRAGIGAMVATLGGMDALVFTAGVGENSPEVRSATCSNLEFLGLKLDATTNAQGSSDRDISTVDSRARVLVIRAQEDWAIAAECWKLRHAETKREAGTAEVQR